MSRRNRSGTDRPQRTRRARPTVRRARSRSASTVTESEIVETLRDLVADEPQGGRLYLVQWRDRPGAVFREALATCGICAASPMQVEAYAHLCGAGRWNRTLYGSRGTSRSFPAAWTVPGLGVGIRSAFLPRNQDALRALLAADRPLCVIDRNTGAAMSPSVSYGLIWLPPVELQGWEITGAAFEWPDGSATLDPPGVLLEAIRDD